MKLPKTIMNEKTTIIRAPRKIKEMEPTKKQNEFQTTTIRRTTYFQETDGNFQTTNVQKTTKNVKRRKKPTYIGKTTMTEDTTRTSNMSKIKKTSTTTKCHVCKKNI